MKLLLFGGSGQLGHELRKRALDLNFDITAPVTSEVDVSQPEQVEFFARKIKPDVIVNAAAYTAVDLAEKESERAFTINQLGARTTAQAAKAVGSRLIYVSTDYVFSGTGTTPLSETDPVDPINQYGKSKLAGEQEVLSIVGDDGLVVRTASLHGQHGENFVHTMLKLFVERQELHVVHDQVMSPTWAGYLAEVLLDLARLKTGGIVHASGYGSCSWLEFAQLILERAKPALEKKNNKSIEVRLLGCSVSDFPRPAQRPRYSAFDCSRLAGILGRQPMTWQAGIDAHLRDLGMLGH